jgi:hypothetical protein
MVPVARAQQPNFQILQILFGAISTGPRQPCISPRHGTLVFHHATVYDALSQSAPTGHSPCRQIICGGSVCWSVRPEIKRIRTGNRPSLAQAFEHEVALTKISASRFAIVLQAIGPPNGRRRKFLRAHYAAPGRAVTATVLAERVGYKGYNGIDLWYGRLAKQIGAFVGERNPDISLLVELVRPPTVTNREWILVMRPEFAVGLKRAGWIED